MTVLELFGISVTVEFAYVKSGCLCLKVDRLLQEFCTSYDQSMPFLSLLSVFCNNGSLIYNGSEWSQILEYLKEIT